MSFGAPDEKYGESVAAAVVLDKPAGDQKALIDDIKRVASEKLASFKVSGETRTLAATQDCPPPFVMASPPLLVNDTGCQLSTCLVELELCSKGFPQVN